MTFARPYRLTTHFSELIPVIKRSTAIVTLRSFRRSSLPPYSAPPPPAKRPTLSRYNPSYLCQLFSSRHGVTWRLFRFPPRSKLDLAFLWEITKRIVVTPCRHFGSSVRNYHHTLCNIQEFHHRDMTTETNSDARSVGTNKASRCKGKGKVHPCGSTEALYRPYGL